MYMYNSLQHTPVRHQPGFLGKLPRQTKKLKTSYKEDTHRDVKFVIRFGRVYMMNVGLSKQPHGDFYSHLDNRRQQTFHSGNTSSRGRGSVRGHTQRPPMQNRRNIASQKGQPFKHKPSANSVYKTAFQPEEQKDGSRMETLLAEKGTLRKFIVFGRDQKIKA